MFGDEDRTAAVTRLIMIATRPIVAAVRVGPWHAVGTVRSFLVR